MMSLKCRYNPAFTKKSWSQANQSATNYKEFLVQILSSFVQLATSGVLVQILSPYESTTVSSPGLNLSSNCQINIWIQARTGVRSLKSRYNAAFVKKSW